MMIAKITRVPLVYDAHEHYAKMIEQDVPGWFMKQVDKLEMALAEKADLVVAANTKIADYLAPISKKVVVVMNCVDVVPMPGLKNERPEGGLVLLYAGSLEPLRFIEELMEIVSRDKRLKLRIAGSGSLQGAVECMAQRNANILFLGRLSRDGVGKEMANADAIVALLDPSNENNRIGTPNRLFEGMAAGVPVLVSAGTFSAEIVQDCGCGLAVDWKKGGLNEALQVLMVPSLRRQMGENGILAAETQYNWKRMKGILVDNYLNLLEGNTLNRNFRLKGG
jgi:glycosyltransferase involved in cell wall biosynthesis